jgi:hypothetical protein
MNRTASLAALVVSLALTGCGPAKEKVEPGTEHRVDSAKPAEAAKPAPAAEAWSSKDAKGFDWAAQMGSVRFDTNWQRAMAEAKKSGKPVLLLFTEKTNADAAKVAAVLKDPRVIAAMAAFVPAIVDNDDNEPLAERYGVRTVPMLVFASPAGEAIGSSIGVTIVDEVLRDIKGALDTMKEDADEAK